MTVADNNTLLGNKEDLGLAANRLRTRGTTPTSLTSYNVEYYNKTTVCLGTNNIAQTGSE